MKRYKIILLGHDQTLYITGRFYLYPKHYLIIDEDNNNNYFPKSRTAILTL